MISLAKRIIRRSYIRLRSLLFRAVSQGKRKFVCPVCGYHGPFAGTNPNTGYRKYAECPKCLSWERHRLQFLVMEKVLAGLETESMSLLHFAPERQLGKYFKDRFGRYCTADLYMRGVDYTVDIKSLPFGDGEFDLVFASHVLEHIDDDRAAIAEIRRVLKKGGLAVLPVPVIAEKTVEYPEANPHEENHVRAPGKDYFERFKDYFTGIEVWSSDQFDEKYQTWIYEDRSIFPTKKIPLRPATSGEKHLDFVPICRT